MEKVKLGKDGPLISPVIYSFWRAMEDPDGVHYDTIKSKLKACLDLGINTFDHADIYGNYQVETLFGKALKEISIKRDKIVIFSKCGINNIDPRRPKHRIRHYDSSPEHVKESVEQSLQNLGLDYLDILLLHHPDPLMDAEETAFALGQLIERGLVKHIGVSDFSVPQHQLLQSCLNNPIIVNHLELNLLNTTAIANGTIDFLKQNHSRPLAWAPLAGGKLIDKNDDSTYNIRCSLKKIALNYNINEEQLAIAWLLKLGALPIVGTNNVNRIKNATSAVNINIDRQDWHEIYFSSLNTKQRSN